MSASRYNMVICGECHQPITRRSAARLHADGRWTHQGFEAAYCSNIGCPMGESILDNLRVAMKQGFQPEFCRTHYTQGH